jgi:catechol 2,3-dioxygenase-like lactoylglutathione lyase family enzyme
LGTRTNHLAFRVDDYEAACRLLEMHGIETVRRVLPDHGYRQVFFYDPDENLIELGEWPVAEKMVV